jgi:N-acetylglutamate synthase
LGLPEIRQIELAGLKAWPGIEVEHDGKWVRRAAGGYTKRANSVQCLDPTDDENAPARIAASRRWFETRGLMPVFRVTPLAGRCLTESLDEMGWKAFDHSRVLVMALERRSIEPDARVEVLPTDDPKWLSAQRLLQGYDATTLERLNAIIAAIEVPTRGILLHSGDGRPLASALMSVADGIVFAGNVVTAASERRKGCGSAAMLSGLAWAVGEGAKVAALNVLADNEPALALYGSVGYAHVYDYHYRKPA